MSTAVCQANEQPETDGLWVDSSSGEWFRISQLDAANDLNKQKAPFGVFPVAGSGFEYHSSMLPLTSINKKRLSALFQ